jgi:ribosome-binding protein aMBF1 (putative translation factor)
LLYDSFNNFNSINDIKIYLYDIKMITSCQIRAARALINWSAKELAEKSNVGVATVRRMELAEGIPSSNAQTLELIIRTLEKAGVEFIGTPDDRPGVRLK